MPEDGGRPAGPRHPEPPFRVVLTTGLIAASVLPLAVFGFIIAIADLHTQPRIEVTLFVAALVGGGLFGLLMAAYTVSRVTTPLRQITSAVERVAGGDPGPALPVTGDDEISRLAESHNRIAAETQRRNRELGRMLAAVASYEPSEGVESLRVQAEWDACAVYGLIDCDIRLVPPSSVPVEERIPGDPRPVRADLRAGKQTVGVLVGHLPATRSWEKADQDLLDLFASEMGVALRNADLFGQIQRQNAQLVELDAAKDEFLRGVSHNLQTPLTSIRAYVEQLRTNAGAVSAAPETTAPAAASGPAKRGGRTRSKAAPAAPQPAGTDRTQTDRRLDIVAEQTDRLTRLVRQLLTVTRLEAGVLKPQPEIVALGPRVRRAWEALNPQGVELRLHDGAAGWLAVADPDQLDQILWALLDNAVKYGGTGGGVDVTILPDAGSGTIRAAIADHGPGISEADRERLFARFSRGAEQASGGGTGLGLYVSRQLARAMGGDLALEPMEPGAGATFTLLLPGESAEAE